MEQQITNENNKKKQSYSKFVSKQQSSVDFFGGL